MAATIIVGAGPAGLGTAHALGPDHDLLILELLAAPTFGIQAEVSYSDHKQVSRAGLTEAADADGSCDVSAVLEAVKTYFQCTALEAELIKYMENSYLATKVTFVNEFRRSARRSGPGGTPPAKAGYSPEFLAGVRAANDRFRLDRG